LIGWNENIFPPQLKIKPKLLKIIIQNQILPPTIKKKKKKNPFKKQGVVGYKKQRG
jgi:hypothetical protein